LIPLTAASFGTAHCCPNGAGTQRRGSLEKLDISRGFGAFFLGMGLILDIFEKCVFIGIRTQGKNGKMFQVTLW